LYEVVNSYCTFLKTDKDIDTIFEFCRQNNTKPLSFQLPYETQI
jgi:hypothetical protein